MAYTVGNEPLISVIIDAYNYGCYIKDAINSVLQQTLPAEFYEIIVVDDGSQDDTRELVAKYLPGIVYLYKENGGQASAFNAGIAVAKGEFVAFLDADDYWHREKLATVLEEFQESEDVDVVYHAQFLVDNAGVESGIFPEYFHMFVNEDPAEYFWQGKSPVFTATSGISFRMSAFKKMMPVPVDLRICADAYFMAAAPLVARRFSIIEKTLGYYRLHGSNIWAEDYLVKRSIESRISLIDMQNSCYCHVEQLALRLGIDCSRVVNALKMQMVLYHSLELKNLSGRWAAIKTIYRYKGLFHKINLRLKLFKISTFALQSVLPARLFEQVLVLYRHSPLLWIVQRYVR